MSTTSIPVRLAGEGVLIRISGSVRLSRLIRDLYGVGAGSSGSGRPDVDIRWSGGRGTLSAEGWPPRRSAALPALGVWAEWVAARKAIDRLRGRSLILHAAWVARGREGVLISGPRGTGKTSLAVALALRHGFRLLADDMVALGEDGRVRPLERPVRLKPGAARVLPEVGSLGLDLDPWRQRWTVLAPLGRFGPRTGPAPKPRAVILLGGSKRGPARRRPLSQGLALAKLARLAFNFKDRPRWALRSLVAPTLAAETFALSGGNLVDRCAAVLELLSEPRTSHGQ